MDGLLVLVLCGAAAGSSCSITHSILLLHTLSYFPLYVRSDGRLLLVDEDMLSYLESFSFVLSFFRSFIGWLVGWLVLSAVLLFVLSSCILIIFSSFHH